MQTLPDAALVGMLAPGWRDPYDLIDYSSDGALRLAAAMLPDDAAARHRVGAIKPRYSRTVGYWYLSNGCADCDAIFGNFYLYVEELGEVLAIEGLNGLVSLAVVAIPESLWEPVLTEHYGESDDDDLVDG